MEGIASGGSGKGNLGFRDRNISGDGSHPCRLVRQKSNPSPLMPPYRFFLWFHFHCVPMVERLLKEQRVSAASAFDGANAGRIILGKSLQS
jgi:hypothetical protein